MMSTTGGSDPEGAPPPSRAEIDHGEYPPLGIFRRVVRETGLGLIVLGLVVLLFVAYQLLGTTLTEQHNQRRLQQRFDQAVAAARAQAPAGAAGQGSQGAGTGAGAGGTSGGRTSGGGTNPGSGASDNPTIGGSPAASNAAVPTGAAVARLEIPAISLDKYVVQGTSEADLAQGPGHYPQTVMPGQVGNAAIAGHRTTYGAPFFRLNNLQKGDPIYITVTSGQTYRYLVTTSEVVSPNDVSVLDPSTTAELTLTTCNPRFSATNRLVVVAKLARTAPAKSKKKAAAPTTTAPTTTAPATTAPATTAPASTTTIAGASTTVPGGATTPTTVAARATAALNLGEGQGSARTPAIVYGALVLLLWILTRLAIHHTRRWHRGVAYLAGIVVCLIPLWFCFENIVRLLPPNI
jgi:sortase A